MFLAALLVGIVALVVVSLLTRPEPAAEIDDLFSRLQRRATTNGRGRCCSSTCCTCAAPPRASGWRTFREDLAGFAVGWLIVIVLVAATVSLFVKTVHVRLTTKWSHRVGRSAVAHPANGLTKTHLCFPAVNTASPEDRDLTPGSRV